MSQTVTELNEHFAIHGVLSFREIPSGLIFADITSPAARATVCLMGAHLMEWQPIGQQPVLFHSRKSDLEPGKPIRGGVPIAFPWFAIDSKQDRYQGKPGPTHGFARIQSWTLAFAALAGEDLHLTFTLAPTDISRQYGFDNFRLAFQLIIGKTLTMQLTVANDAAEPLVFEEALHTYYQVADVHEVTLTGLEPTSFIDKTDDFKVKPALHAPLAITAFTDRIYPDTTATCVIHDPAWRRRLIVGKANSNTTVVFNPWKEMPDLDANDWHEFLCVEAVNAGATKVTLPSGKTHTMQAHVAIEPLKT